MPRARIKTGSSGDMRDPGTTPKTEAYMSLITILIIVVLVLLVLGFLGRGRL